MRILFIRFGSIGNAISVIPAIRAVRKELADSYLALLCNPETFELWKECPYLDEVLVYDQKNKHKAGPGYLKLIYELRKRKFSCSIHFRRFTRSELIGFLSGAKIRIGFDPNGFSLLTKKIPYLEDEPIIEQNLKLVKALGIKADDKKPEYWTQEPSQKVASLLENLHPPIILIHPFAKTQEEKIWKKFPELSIKLKEKLNASIVIIGEKKELEKAKERFQDNLNSFTPCFGLSIPELASLLKKAKLLVGTDSGPVHLAKAVGTPAIIIYSPERNLETHLKKWKPEGDNYIAILPEKDCAVCPSYPCSKNELDDCIEKITVEKVVEKVTELFAKI